MELLNLNKQTGDLFTAEEVNKIGAAIDKNTTQLNSLIENGTPLPGAPNTSDYEKLSNKPSIEGRELSGELTAEDLGMVKSEPGKGLSEENFTSEEKRKLKELSQHEPAPPYQLPIASQDMLGGIKIGKGLNVSEDGTVSADTPPSSEPAPPYRLPIASKEELGGIKIGEGLNVSSDGTVSVQIPSSNDPYELPIASNDRLGGVKIGAGIVISHDGTISVPGSSVEEGSGVSLEYINQVTAPIANKKYSPSENSGMGRVYLPKNDGRISSSAFSDTNTIYIIQYDFQIQGNITVPINSTLRFEGGSLKGGKIGFNQTTIEGNARFIDTPFSGTITNEDVRMDWFVNTNGIYDTAYMKQFLSLHLGNRHHYIYLSNRRLKLNNCNVANIKNLTFIGDKITSIIEVPRELDRRQGALCLSFLNSKFLNFKGIRLMAPDCESIVSPEGMPQNIYYATPVLTFQNCESVGIYNCLFDQMSYVSPICLKLPRGIIIHHNTFVDYDSGIILHQDGSEGIGRDLPESEDETVYAVKITDNYFGGDYDLSEPITFKTNRIFKIEISGNYIANKSGAGGVSLKLIHSKSQCMVMNNVFEKCGYGVILERSRCHYFIMGNKFINNVFCQICVYDNASATITNNYFTGHAYIVKTEVSNEATDAHISVFNNIFENSGSFAGKCNYIISQNQYVNCTTTPSIQTDGNFTFTNNYKDANSTFSGINISYRKSVGKNKLIIRDNGFKVNLSGLNNENIDESSFIETDRSIKIQHKSSDEWSPQQADSNTLYIIT